MKNLFIMATFAVIAIAGPRISRAQVGTGWTEVHPASHIQVEAHDKIKQFPGDSRTAINDGGSYSNSDGVETFEIKNRTANRVERRYLNDYRSGTRQFQADVTIFEPSDMESIHQIFHGTHGGPWLIVRQLSERGGSVRMGGETHSDIFATGLYGKAFRLNSVHDADKGEVWIYINGSLMWKGKSPDGYFYT